VVEVIVAMLEEFVKELVTRDEEEDVVYVDAMLSLIVVVCGPPVPVAEALTVEPILPLILNGKEYWNVVGSESKLISNP